MTICLCDNVVVCLCDDVSMQGILKGPYHCTIDLLFDKFGITSMITDNFCFYLQNRLIQTSKTGGQWYSDTSPFSIPWVEPLTRVFKFEDSNSVMREKIVETS